MICQVHHNAIVEADKNRYAAPFALLNGYITANAIARQAQFYDAASKRTSVDIASKEGDKTVFTIINGESI